MGLNTSQVYMLPIDIVEPNPHQPRKTFVDESLAELCQSIKSVGIIQPIIVTKAKDDKYQLIAGERRLRAAKMAGLREIPAIVRESKQKDSAVMALIENLQREDLHFLEESEGYAQLINDFDLTQEELAKMVGKNQSTIANKLRILKLPDNVKHILASGSLTERHARALLKLPDPVLQSDAAKQFSEKKLNVKEAELLVDEQLKKIASPKDIKQQRKIIRAVRNLKIFLNTIKEAVNVIRNAGVEAKYSEKEFDEFYEVTIRIPKQ
jgi:ParB family chromosome partitioning protein